MYTAYARGPGIWPRSRRCEPVSSRSPGSRSRVYGDAALLQPGTGRADSGDSTYHRRKDLRSRSRTCRQCRARPYAALLRDAQYPVHAIYARHNRAILSAPLACRDHLSSCACNLNYTGQPAGRHSPDATVLRWIFHIFATSHQDEKDNRTKKTYAETSYPHRNDGPAADLSGDKHSLRARNERVVTKSYLSQNL